LSDLVPRPLASTAVRPEAHVTTLRQRVVDDGIALDRCWRVVRRRWRIIAAFEAIALCVVAAVLLAITPRYTAKSTLLIEPEAPQLLDVKQLIDGSESSDEHDYYKTQFELLKSRDLADRVISELDLEHNPAFNLIGLKGRLVGFLLSPFNSLFGGKPEKLSPKDSEAVSRFEMINHYLDSLKVEPLAGTRLATVSFTAPDRNLAARIVDRHVHDYVDMGIELRAQAGKSAHDFLASQLVDIGRRMQDSEARLNAYRLQMGIVSFGVDEKNSVAAQRMADLNRALINIDTQRVEAQAEMKLVDAGDYDSLPQVVSNPAITALEPEVRNLQAEYARLSESFKPGYPKLDEAEAQMVSAQRALNAEIRNVAKAVQRKYVAADAEEQRLQSEIDAEKQKDLAINSASLRDAVLVRDVETNRQLYQNVLRRMQEMQVTEQAPLSNISILDNAVVSHFPTTPKSFRDLAIAGLLVLFVGIGTVFYEDAQDDRLHTVEELEEFLELPTLAVVPDFARLGSLSSRRRRIGTSTTQDGQSIGQVADVRRNLTGYHPRGYIAGTAETYRMIRTSLQFSRAGSPPRTVVVSSAIKGEGKTSTAANTALVFAHTGAKTLLVDADLRRPSCHSLMNAFNHVGLSDVLAGQLSLETAIRSTTVENLFFLSAGSPAPNPAELLTSSTMRQTISALAENFDMVLIDSAPLMLTSDTCVMASMVDGVLLVAGAHTSKRYVQRACQRLHYVGAKILGVVFNRVNMNDPGNAEFRDYYFSYGEYESGAEHEGSPDPDPPI
jgi:polysaccharide biosynthesis transport protein